MANVRPWSTTRALPSTKPQSMIRQWLRPEVLAATCTINSWVHMLPSTPTHLDSSATGDLTTPCWLPRDSNRRVDCLRHLGT